MIRRRLESGAHYVAVTGSGRGFEGVGPYMFLAEAAPTAAPTNITVLRTGNSMAVTWDPVPGDASGGAVTRYVVVATPSDGGSPHMCEAGPDADGCTLEGLEDDAEYVHSPVRRRDRRVAVATQRQRAIGSRRADDVVQTCRAR